MPDNSSENSLVLLSRAEKWLVEAKDLKDLRQIHDIAIAAEAYAKAHRLGIDSENHAREIKFLAARRIGELVPPQPAGKINPKRQSSEERSIEISRQRLSDFRQLAKIPEEEFRR